MNDDAASAAGRSITTGIVRVVLGAAAILLVPLVAMRFTTEVAWTLRDFVAAGALLVGAGLLYVFFSRKARTARTRIAIGAALCVALLLAWAELAVGIVGTPFAGS